MQKFFFILGVCALGAFVCSQSVDEQAVVKDDECGSGLADLYRRR